ncbi:type I restriction-modification system subunit M [Aeoliella sp. ICT_H6.2]|uniref:site-specific DNA-methyltransferase (adenine-specific) n=1 Tax=Aeoliella straminimaris TaxID=2954799 RepID=A0A9X2F7Y5_9BACT|nr:class I SAM-dependent DNA methyltransferase [Aeoliella straminimaris]MCO6043298.1 type I restriction-modification system subunit M [Aeoliella straminimaris]
MSISTTVKSIQDIMRKDAGTYGDAQRIEQLAWMFFLKILDDREAEEELLQDDYQSPLKEKFRWRNWAADEEGMTGDTLLDFVDNKLLKELKNLPTGAGGNPRAAVIRMAFDDANQYMKNGTLMRQVVNKINQVDFNNSKDRHLFGDVYEQILKDLQSAGNAGEFYTPRAVTQFMVERTSPKLGESILDPACGTGGFLTAAIEHVRTNDVKTAKQEEKLQASIHGVEKKHLPHILCITNMLLHGIEVPANIRHDNTLSRPLRDYGPKDRVDVVVTNPPFGGMEEDGIELNFPKAFQTRETADLFLVLIMHRLKPGGRGAIVLPDGTLFGEGVKTRIKERLLTECNLHTIVRLPNGVFNPYTGIKTNLLFFTKGEPTKDIWYYEHPYPPGAKSYNKTKPIRLEEFEPERQWWGKPDARGGFKGRKANEQAWKVSAKDIAAAGYNLDIKNPHSADTGPGDPDELLAELHEVESGIQETLGRLRSELATALGGEPE